MEAHAPFDHLTAALMAFMTAFMPDSSRDDAQGGAHTARARLRGKRLAVVLFIAFAVLFVGSSASQIVQAVFRGDGPPLPSTGPGTPAGVCAGGMASLVRALDRAAGAAKSTSASALDSNEAVNVFRQGLRPEWDERPTIERACASSPEGLDSWAALLRLHEAVEQWIRRESIALAPLRRDVMEHLPANLR